MKLVMHCATSSTLSLIWNGNRLLAFSLYRGLQQGDPLSLYLFVICIEKFSLAINEYVLDGLWQPIKIYENGPSLSHLFFC